MAEPETQKSNDGLQTNGLFPKKKKKKKKKQDGGGLRTYFFEIRLEFLGFLL